MAYSSSISLLLAAAGLGQLCLHVVDLLGQQLHLNSQLHVLRLYLLFGSIPDLLWDFDLTAQFVGSLRFSLLALTKPVVLSRISSLSLREPSAILPAPDCACFNTCKEI